MDRNSKDLFAVLVSENSAMLLAYIRASVDDQSIVDDIYQETMVTAWRKLADYDRTRPFARWLRGIAHKLVLSYYSKLKRKPIYCEETVLTHIENEMLVVESKTGDTWEEKTEVLEQCIGKLPENFRKTIELHYKEEHKTEEIATLMEASREAVKKRLQRARAMLAECLKRNKLFSEKSEASFEA